MYYRGTNDAWDGYGGAVVYSTKPELDPAYVPELTKLAEKVGVNFSDFVVTDNSCKPAEPLRMSKIADLDTLGDDVRVVEKDLGRGVRTGSRFLGREARILSDEVGRDARLLSREVGRDAIAAEKEVERDVAVRRSASVEGFASSRFTSTLWGARSTDDVR